MLSGFAARFYRTFVRGRSCKVAFCTCVFAARALAAETEEQFVDLKYDVDPALQDCPSAVEFRSIIAQQLGYDPYGPGADLGVEVRVRALEGGLEGTIDWSTADANKLGERHFTSRNGDCRAMMTTVGFVVAVQIQLMATEKTKSNAPRPEEQHGTAEGQQPVASPADLMPSVTLSVRSFDVRAPSSNSANWSMRAGLGTSIGLGLAPNTVGQGRLFFGGQREWFEIEAAAEATLPSNHREPYGAGFRQELFLGALALCGRQAPIAACAVGKAGRIQVNGTGVDKPVSSSGLLAQVGPRLAYALELGNHLVLLGHIEGLYSLTPWTVDLNQVDVWKMSRFSALAGMDLAAKFP